MCCTFGLSVVGGNPQRDSAVRTNGSDSCVAEHLIDKATNAFIGAANFDLPRVAFELVAEKK